MERKSSGILGIRYVACAVVVAVVATVSVVSGGHASSKRTASAVPSYHNPVFAKDIPDPMVLRLNAHDYYAYGTNTVWEKGEFPILHSSDLVHWKYVGDLFKIGHAPTWMTGDMWAPDVIKHGKTFYAYFVGNNGNGHCIGVATSSNPVTGFKSRGIVGCGDATGQGYIDPAVLIDRDGKAYLYVSVDNPQHNISVIPLKSDLIAASGARKELFGLSQAWEHGANFSTVEGPFPLRFHNTYYVFYSGNDWNGNYSMGYAAGPSPTGPLTKCSCNPILTGDARVHGPGGGSVVTGPDGKLWMVYHAWPGKEGYNVGGIRNMRIDPLRWNGSTFSVHVTP